MRPAGTVRGKSNGRDPDADFRSNGAPGDPGSVVEEAACRETRGPPAMHASSGGPFGALLMIAPLAAIPVFAIIGVPHFTPVAASPAR